MAKHKSVTVHGNMGQLADAISELQSLAEEAREICDNMPENLHSTPRYEAFDATAEALESIDEPDIPGCLDGMGVFFAELVPARRRPLSRVSRRDNAVFILEGCKLAAEDFLDEQKEIEEVWDEETQGEFEPHAELEDVEYFISALTDIIDWANDCEFPGMFG